MNKKKYAALEKKEESFKKSEIEYVHAHYNCIMFKEQ